MRFFQELQDVEQDNLNPPTKADADGNYMGAPLGLPLSDLRAYRLTCLAPKGQSINSTATIYAWFFSASQKRWVRAPEHDVVLDGLEGANVTGGLVVEREILVGDASTLYFNRFNLGFSGTATNPSEADKLFVRIDGVSRKE